MAWFGVLIAASVLANYLIWRWHTNELWKINIARDLINQKYTDGISKICDEHWDKIQASNAVLLENVRKCVEGEKLEVKGTTKV